MPKKMLIDATHAEETRIVVADGTRVDDFDFETLNKRQLAGNIYLAKVTRVEPSLQAAFIDYGGNRHGFLAFAEIHPDYYQIPAADRAALIEEDRAAAEAAEEEADRGNRRRRNDRNGERAERAKAADPVVRSTEIPGMEVADHSADDTDEAVESGFAAAGGDVVDPTVAGQGGDAAAPEPAPQDGPTEAMSPIDRDDEIESVAEEDVAEEIRPARKPRARRYKIQEVIKVRQIMLVQVVKEERGNKGAALTTYLSLAGRYCVLMPNTARGGGISRKITNIADRKKLKDIASDLEVPQGAGLIIRTAGSQRTRTEIKRDYEYLMRLWEQIRERTFKSIAPAPIYEEGDLIKRTIRDLYSKDIDEVWVEGERGYRTAKDFMAMIMPSHAKNVKHYTDPMPLFARYQVEGYLSGMFNPVVQLKSGGYIVIGITEALVAIDVNSGRATKEGSIEDTAYKTNCEAADEIARQLRLRDLAGLIVIDFIDMDERKNNAAVEKRFKEALKNDRARIQIGRISGFGLMEMSRQRLRPGMLESTTQPCAHCHGTGLIRSDDSMALTILRAIEEEGTRKRSREVLVKAPVAVANFLMNQKREHVSMIETRFGMAVRVEADPSLISPDYAIEKFKTATRNVPVASSAALSVDASLMAQIDEADEALEEIEDAEIVEEAEAPREQAERAEAADEDDGEGRGRRRRRRRRGGRARNGEDTNGDAVEASDDAGAAESDSTDAATDGEGETEHDGARRSRSRSRRRRNGRDNGGEGAAADEAIAAETEAADAVSADLSAVIDESREAPAGTEPVVTGGKPANADGESDDSVDAGHETAASLQDDLPVRAQDERTEAAAPTSEVEGVEGVDATEDQLDQPAIGAQVDELARATQPAVTGDAPANDGAGALGTVQPAADDAEGADNQTAAATAEDRAGIASPAAEKPSASPEAASEDSDRPKRRGWWSFG